MPIAVEVSYVQLHVGLQPRVVLSFVATILPCAKMAHVSTVMVLELRKSINVGQGHVLHPHLPLSLPVPLVHSAERLPNVQLRMPRMFRRRAFAARPLRARIAASPARENALRGILV